MEPWLELDVYDAERPVAYSRTTYLDTDQQDFYRSCQEGPVARRLRIREYAAAARLDELPELTGMPFLEYKESSGARRRKARFAAPPDVITALIDGKELPDVWHRQLAQEPEIQAFEAAFREQLLAPRMTTWYRRVSLSAPGVRVTLDEGIWFCPPVRPGNAGEPATPELAAAGGPGRIVEVKVQDQAPPWLVEAMDGLTESTHFSKFVAGTATLRSSRRAARRHTTIPIPVTADSRIKRLGPT